MTDSNQASDLKLPSTHVALRDVVVASFMFHSLTNYNQSLHSLRKNTRGAPDFTSHDHRGYLLTWLNAWGCRHLAKNEHGTASASIREWYEEMASLLPPADALLWELGEQDLKQAASAYSSLRKRAGARGTGKRNGQVIPIGATAASKVLFALRPNALAPWDEKMRRKLGYGAGGKGYLDFLKLIRARAKSLEDQCRKNGFDIAELPRVLGRDKSYTVLALLNEHMWITVSAGVKLPSQETLASWSTW